MIRHALSAAVLVTGSMSSPAYASDCSDAQDRYEQAVSEVNSTLRRYSRCINGGDATNDCYVEFRRLKNAHDELASAVEDVEAYCVD